MHRGRRQDADVVCGGERVDGPTARAPLTAAELGYLVISTMRASSAAHSVQRLIELFPPIDQGQVRHALGSTLRGIVNQRLLERADGRGRIPAVEVLVGTSKVAEAVADPAHQTPLDQLIAEGQYPGMQTRSEERRVGKEWVSTCRS